MQSLSEIKQSVAEALRRKDYAAAEAVCQSAQGHIDIADLLFLRGVVVSAQGQKAAALCCLEQAYAAAPDRADIAYNYGVVLREAGRDDEAIAAWRRAVEIDPSWLAAWQKLSAILAARGGNAEQVYRQALRVHPQDRDLRFALAGLLARLGHEDEAVPLYADLARDFPQDADILINAGKCYKDAGDAVQAEVYYRRALIMPDPSRRAVALFNYSHLLLAQKRWAEGFAAYEARLALPSALATPWGVPVLETLSPQGGSLLLWSDQGLGDAIMFARFAAPLRAMGYKLTALVQPALQTLFQSMPEFDAVLTPMDAPRAFDSALSLSSLPHRLQINPDRLSGQAYIPEPNTSPLPTSSPARFKVGLVWSGNPAQSNDRYRSLSFADVEPLLDLPCAWACLHKDAPDITDPRLEILAPRLTDFAATAQAIAALDLVITVDTAVAHLAGAMGKDVWIILPSAHVDWRWGDSGETCAWYASARLFRRAKGQSGAEVVAAIRAELLRKREGRA